MTPARTAIFLVLTTAAVVMAEEAKFVQTAVDEAAMIPIANFATAKPGVGTVNPRAVVGSATVGNRHVYVAVDADDPKRDQANILRIDFSGQGKFDKAVCLPIAMREGGMLGFGPRVMKVNLDGRDVPMTIHALYRSGAQARVMVLHLGVAIEARVDIGGKAHAIRIRDGDGNLHFNDSPRFVGGRLLPGDWIERTPEDGKGVVLAGVGCPIKIGDGWFSASPKEDGSKIDVAPFKGEIGKLGLTGASNRLTISGRRYTYVLQQLPRSLDEEQTEDVVEMPADEYRIIEAKVGGLGGGATMKPAAAGSGIGPVIVRGGEKTRLAAGASLIARVSVTASGDDLLFVVSVKDGEGLEVVDYGLARLMDPKISIVDAAGNVVHEAALAYRKPMDYRLSWKPPRDLKGQFKVKVSEPVWSIPVKCAETTFTLPATRPAGQ